MSYTVSYICNSRSHVAMRSGIRIKCIRRTNAIVGVFHSVTTWPVLLLVRSTGLETFDADSIPWPDLCAAIAFTAG